MSFDGLEIDPVSNTEIPPHPILQLDLRYLNGLYCYVGHYDIHLQDRSLRLS